MATKAIASVLGGSALLAGVLHGCATGGAEADDVTLTVYAASSLRVAFEQIGEQFERENPGVTVRLNVAGSSDLAAQIEQGAPADVFASADLVNMDRLAADGLLASPAEPFATNKLAIVVPSDNPAGVESLDDLVRPEVHLVVCAVAVPCGAAAARVEQAAGLDWQPVSEEPSVADVLGKVGADEADAGLVYVTDVLTTNAPVRGIDFALASDAVNTYPIAPVVDSDEAALAARFVAFVLGAEGQRVLADLGFGEA